MLQISQQSTCSWGELLSNRGLQKIKTEYWGLTGVGREGKENEVVMMLTLQWQAGAISLRQCVEN